jgi:nucleoside phosphorylase
MGYVYAASIVLGAIEKLDPDCVMNAGSAPPE